MFSKISGGEIYCILNYTLFYFFHKMNSRKDFKITEIDKFNFNEIGYSKNIQKNTIFC